MTTLANLTTYISGESDSFISAVNTSRGGLRALISSLDPVAAATAKYNRQVDLLDKGLRQNQLTLEQHGVAMGRLSQRYQQQIAGQSAVVTSSGNMRAGMQQLSFQLGDVATQFASGTRPMIIFAQQGGQIIQALGMMTNSTKGLLGFLGGPWGQIITAAAIVLVPLIDNLMQSGDAADGAADKLMSYTDALKRLQDQAGSFSFGDAAFKVVDDAAKYADARVNRLRKELNTAPVAASNKVLPSGLFAPGSPSNARPVRTRADVQQELGEALVDLGNKQGAVNAFLMARRNRDLLNTPAPDKAKRERKPRGRDASRDQSRYEDQLGGLQVSIARATADLTGSIYERHKATMAQLDEERASFKRQIEADKGLTDAKRQTLLAAKDEEIETRKQIAEEERYRALARETFELFADRNAALQDQVRDELAGARTTADRLAGELRLLDLQKQAEAAALDRIMAEEATTSAAWAIANRRKQELGEVYGRRADAIRRDNMSPLARYIDQVPRTAAETAEIYERIAADGLDRLNDGLADAIMGTKSLKDAFSDMASGIVRELLRIAIQQQIIKPLAESLFGSMNGAGGGSVGGLLRGFFGGGSKGIVSGDDAVAKVLGQTGFPRIPGFAKGGSFLAGGIGGVDRNVLSVNGVPRAMISASEMVTVTPPGMRSANDNVVRVVPSPYFNVVVDGRVINGIGQAAPAMVGASAGVTQSKAQYRAGRRLA